MPKEIDELEARQDEIEKQVRTQRAELNQVKAALAIQEIPEAQAAAYQDKIKAGLTHEQAMDAIKRQQEADKAAAAEEKEAKAKAAKADKAKTPPEK